MTCVDVWAIERLCDGPARLEKRNFDGVRRRPCELNISVHTTRGPHRHDFENSTYDAAVSPRAVQIRAGIDF